MKKILLTAFLAITSVISIVSAYAQTQTPATHMWIRTGVNSVIFINVSSVEQCVLLTQQASNINSSNSLCYNGPTLLSTIDCQKSSKRGEAPNCKSS